MRVFLGNYTKDQKLADLHIHTNNSDGLMSPKQVVDLAVETGRLNAIAITDHDTIKPAIAARDYCLKMANALNIIVGSEITTADGHVLGLYLETDIPKNNSLAATILEIHKQAGLAIIPHPLRGEQSLNEASIINIMGSANPNLYFDGFEIFNSSINTDLKDPVVKKTTVFYLENKTKLGAPIGSSGGHFLTIGRGLTGFKGDLKNAIKSTQTTVTFLDQEETAKLIDLSKKLFPKEMEKAIRLYENLELIESPTHFYS